MLSIAIPIYNRDVTSLVNELQKQCEKANINYEILLLDDDSSQFTETNKKLGQEMYISYSASMKNKGRSKSRNRLYEYARYVNVLFLDCDVKVPDSDFVSNYLSYIPYQGIICGGISYEKTLPDEKFSLRWKYGQKVESINASKRNKKSHLFFVSANILLNKNLIPSPPFDESINQYGYEDSLLAQKCKNDQIKIFHIDNPVVHLGLDTNQEYLDKLKQAIQNLHQLRNNNEIESTRLIDLSEWLSFHKLTDRFMTYMDKRHEKFEKNLLSENPSIFKLQLWKLYQYEIYRRKQQEIE